MAAAVAAAMLALGALPSTNSPSDVPDEVTVQFTAAGDFGASTAAQAVLSQIHTPGNDLTLALGDLSYGVTGAEQAWCDIVTDRVDAGYPFQLLAGNHESDGQNGNINDFSSCLPNQLPGAVGTYGRQYFVDVPAGAPLVRYVMISPGIRFSNGLWSYDAGTPRYAWTAATIDAARAAGIPWVVVGMHKPCLSVGEYACDPGADIMNLLVSKRVDLVLSGHEHHYARTAQLTNGTTECPSLSPGSYAASCVADTDADISKGMGTVFGTVGTGGVGLRSVRTDDPEAGYFSATSGSDKDPAHGFLQVALTADRMEGRFVAVTSTAFSDMFTVTRRVGNLSPNASFTSTTTAMSVTLDASASIDPDGSIVSYSWDFGDNTTAEGRTITHTYTTPGEHLVALTVADDDGATATMTQPVTVSEPPAGPAPIATDAFERTLTSQWGTADLGGVWTVTGGATNFTVEAGAGHIRMSAPGATPGAHLSSIDRTNTEVRVVVGQDKPPTGTGTTVRVQPRRLPNGDGYFAAVRFVPNGSVVLKLIRLIGTQTSLQSSTVPNLTHAPGDRFHVRTQTAGVSPTTVRAKVWKVGTSEPSAWMSTATDASAALQTTGSIGLRTELGSAATNAPVRATFDDLWVGPLVQ